LDALSDVLRVIRLQGALFLHAEFGSPWCVAAPGGAQLAQALKPGAAHLVIFHLVTQGRRTVQIGREAPLQLEAGDIVAFPHADSHRIGSTLHAPPLEMSHVMSELRQSRLSFSRHGGDGEPARLICGWLSAQTSPRHPMFSAMPRVLRVPIREQASGAWIESSIRHLVLDPANESAGRAALTARLAEALFIETLRCHIAGLPADQTGWLAGLRDPIVGRAIALLHEFPGQDWTVESLARRVDSSRTVLSGRFVRYLGQAPMQYLGSWRLTLAADLLREGALSLGRIAEQVGYETEAAFNRAFKRAYGLPPGAWRRTQEGQATTAD
jgi:AraC-like DNA-binding protein